MHPISEARQKAIEARDSVRAADAAMAQAEDQHDAARTHYAAALRRVQDGEQVSNLAALADATDAASAAVATARRRLERAKASLHEAEKERDKLVADTAAEDAELARRPSGRVPGAAGVVAEPRAATGTRYRDLFEAPVASSEFRTSSAFLQAVASGQHHPHLVPAATAMRESSGSAGGWLVPSELSAEYFDAALEMEVVRPRARVYGMASDTRKIAGFKADGGGGTTGPYGFRPQWLAEAGSIGTVEPMLRKVELQARKLALLVQASNELLMDGLSYGEQLDRVMRQAIAWSLDHAFLNGSGSGQPLGALNAPCTIEVAKEDGQGADTFEAENALNMLSRLLPGSFSRAVWVVSSTLIPQLFTLNVAIGTAGALLPYFAVDAAGNMRLLGLPVVPSEKLPALGNRGDVLLADFSYYAVGLRKEVTIDRSQHVGFSSDVETFRGLLRADGQPLLERAYTGDDGVTRSAFVTLAERA